jgi:hypothetical protein
VGSDSPGPPRDPLEEGDKDKIKSRIEHNLGEVSPTLMKPATPDAPQLHLELMLAAAGRRALT